MIDDCVACGKCCNKKWLVRLTSKREIELFGDDVVFGNFIWTDKCKFKKGSICTIHEDKPFKCKEYYCEGRKL